MSQDRSSVANTTADGNQAATTTLPPPPTTTSVATATKADANGPKLTKNQKKKQRQKAKKQVQNSTEPLVPVPNTASPVITETSFSSTTQQIPVALVEQEEFIADMTLAINEMKNSFVNEQLIHDDLENGVPLVQDTAASIENISVQHPIATEFKTLEEPALSEMLSSVTSSTETIQPEPEVQPPSTTEQAPESPIPVVSSSTAVDVIHNDSISEPVEQVNYIENKADKLFEATPEQQSLPWDEPDTLLLQVAVEKASPAEPTSVPEPIISSVASPLPTPVANQPGQTEPTIQQGTQQLADQSKVTEPTTITQETQSVGHPTPVIEKLQQSSAPKQDTEQLEQAETLEPVVKREEQTEKEITSEPNPSEQQHQPIQEETSNSQAEDLFGSTPSQTDHLFGSATNQDEDFFGSAQQSVQTEAAVPVPEQQQQPSSQFEPIHQDTIEFSTQSVESDQPSSISPTPEQPEFKSQTNELKSVFTQQPNSTSEAFDKIINEVEEIKQEIVHDIQVSHSRKTSRGKFDHLDLDDEVLPSADNTVVYTPADPSGGIFESSNDGKFDDIFGSNGANNDDLFGSNDKTEDLFGSNGDKAEEDLFGNSSAGKDDFSTLIQKKETDIQEKPAASKFDKFSFLEDELLDDDLLEDEPQPTTSTSVAQRIVSQPAQTQQQSGASRYQGHAGTAANPYRSVSSYAPQQAKNFGSNIYSQPQPQPHPQQTQHHLDLQKLEQQKQKSDAYDFPVDLIPTKPIHRPAPVPSQAQFLQKNLQQAPSPSNVPSFRNAGSTANFNQQPPRNPYAPAAPAPTGAPAPEPPYADTVGNQYAPHTGLQKQPSNFNLSIKSTPSTAAASTPAGVVAPPQGLKKKQSSFFEELPITTPIPTRRKPTATRSSTTTPGLDHSTPTGPPMVNPYAAGASNAPPLPLMPQGLGNSVPGQPPLNAVPLNPYAPAQGQQPQGLLNQIQPQAPQQGQSPNAGPNRYAPNQPPMNPYGPPSGSQVPEQPAQKVGALFPHQLPLQAQKQQQAQNHIPSQGPYAPGNRSRGASATFAPMQQVPSVGQFGTGSPGLPNQGPYPYGFQPVQTSTAGAVPPVNQFDGSPAGPANPYAPAQPPIQVQSIPYSFPAQQQPQPGPYGGPASVLPQPPQAAIGSQPQNPRLSPLLTQVAANASDGPILHSPQGLAGSPATTVSLPSASKYAPINHRRQASATANQYDPNSIAKFQSQHLAASKTLVHSGLNPMAHPTQQQPQQLPIHPQAGIPGHQQLHQTHQQIAQPEQLAYRQYPLFSWSNTSTVATLLPSVNAYGALKQDIKIIKIDSVLNDDILKDFPFPNKKNIPAVVKFIEKRIELLKPQSLSRVDQDELLLLQVLKFKLNREQGTFDLGEVINYIEPPAQHFHEKKAVGPLNKRHLVSLISTGQREQAIGLALSHQNYALALLISSVIDRDSWVKMVGEYLNYEFNGDNDNFLSTIFQVLSGNVTGIIQGFRSHPNKKAWAIANWKALTNAIVANSSALPVAFLKEFGDFLVENGQVSSALVLFVLGELPLKLYTSVKLNVYLEIYGLILQEKNLPADLTLVHLQQAYNLIDYNLAAEAQKYLDVAIASSKSSPIAETEVVKYTLRLLNDRLSGSDGAQGWFGRPKLDKVWGQLDKSLNKFISGDDVKETPKDSVFSKFSPSNSRTSSSVSLYNQGSEISMGPYGAGSRAPIQSAASNLTGAGKPPLRSQTSQYDFYANTQASAKSFVNPSSALNHGSSITRAYTPPVVGNTSINTAESLYLASQSSSVPFSSNAPPVSGPKGHATFSIPQSPGKANNRYDPNSRRSSVQSNTGISAYDGPNGPLFQPQQVQPSTQQAQAATVPQPPLGRSLSYLSSNGGSTEPFQPKPPVVASALPTSSPALAPLTIFSPKQAATVPSNPVAQAIKPQQISASSSYNPPTNVPSQDLSRTQVVHTLPPVAKQRVPSIVPEPPLATSTKEQGSGAVTELKEEAGRSNSFVYTPSAPLANAYQPPQAPIQPPMPAQEYIQAAKTQSTVDETTQDESLESNKSTLVPDHSFGGSVGESEVTQDDAATEEEQNPAEVEAPAAAATTIEEPVAKEEDQFDPEAEDPESAIYESEPGNFVSPAPPNHRSYSNTQSDYGSTLATPYDPSSLPEEQDANENPVSLPATPLGGFKEDGVGAKVSEQTEVPQPPSTEGEQPMTETPKQAAAPLSKPPVNPYAPPPVNPYAPKTGSPSPVASNPYAPSSSSTPGPRRSASANRFTPKNCAPIEPQQASPTPVADTAVEPVEVDRYGYNPVTPAAQEQEKADTRTSSVPPPPSNFSPYQPQHLNEDTSPRHSLLYQPTQPQLSIQPPNQVQDGTNRAESVANLYHQPNITPIDGQFSSPVEPRFAPMVPTGSASNVNNASISEPDSFPHVSTNISYSQISYEPPSAKFTSYEPPTLGAHKIDKIPEEDEQYYDDVIEDTDDDDEEEESISTSKSKKADSKKKEDEESHTVNSNNINGNNAGWLSWLRKGSSDNKSKDKVYRAKLGEESSFYYDEALGKWINKNADPEEQKKASEPVAPPPVIRAKPRTMSRPRTDSASDSNSLRSLPESNAQSPSVVSPTSGVEPPTPMTGVPPALKKPSASVAGASDLDSLLGAAAGTSTRRKKRSPRGYVDIMSQPKSAE